MADKGEKIIRASLESVGMHVRFDKTSKKENTKDPGRSDLMCGMNGKVAYVEIKTGTTSFRFDKWSEDQRKWAEWAESQNGSEYWMWVVVGKHYPNYNETKFMPRKSWLIPLSKMKLAIRLLSEYQNSIPYRSKKGLNKFIQEKKLDCHNLWDGYEVPWIPGGWSIPKTHPFYKKFIMKEIKNDRDWMGRRNRVSGGNSGKYGKSNNKFSSRGNGSAPINRGSKSSRLPQTAKG